MNLRALANVLKREGRFAQAASMLRRAIQRAMQPHQMYVELGLVDLTMGLPQRALQDFEKAEKANPFLPGEGATSEFLGYLDEGEVKPGYLWQMFMTSKGIVWKRSTRAVKRN